MKKLSSLFLSFSFFLSLVVECPVAVPIRLNRIRIGSKMITTAVKSDVEIGLSPLTKKEIPIEKKKSVIKIEVSASDEIDVWVNGEKVHDE